MATIPTQTAPHMERPPKLPAPSQASASSSSKAPGLSFSRHFTKPGVSPFDEITWEFRDAIIQDFKGKTIFEQKDVEVPADWSMTATNIVASKYLHGHIGTPSARPASAPSSPASPSPSATGASRDGYFATAEDAATFYAELAHLLLNAEGGLQLARLVQRRLRPPRAQLRRAELALGPDHRRASSSRVTGYTQSAVLGLLHQLRRTTRSTRILTLAKTEGMLFKWGSGAGTNLSQHPRLAWRRSPAAAPPPAR